MAFIKRTPEKKEEIKKILNMKKNDDDDDDYDKDLDEDLHVDRDDPVGVIAPCLGCEYQRYITGYERPLVDNFQNYLPNGMLTVNSDYTEIYFIPTEDEDGKKKQIMIFGEERFGEGIYLTCELADCNGENKKKWNNFGWS